MREIKFRYWSADHKQLVYSDRWEVFGIINPKDEVAIGVGARRVDVNPRFYPIMQFTGLKDKHGKEIYEGDILRFLPETEWDINNFSCFEVFFHGGDANLDYNIGFSINRMHNHGAIAGGFTPMFKQKTASEMVVIGNIYENPGLLNP